MVGVDEPNRSLRVRAAVYEGMFDDPKTVASLRTIPLPDAALQLLAARKMPARRTGDQDLIYDKGVPAKWSRSEARKTI